MSQIFADMCGPLAEEPGGVGVKRPERLRGNGFLRIAIDGPRNGKNAMLIAPDVGRVHVRVSGTDEKLMIARSCGHQITRGSLGRF